MPRVKKIDSDKANTAPKSKSVKKKTTTKSASSKKNPAKKAKEVVVEKEEKKDSLKKEVTTKKKAKPIIIDVIEDDEDKSEETFFSDDSLSAHWKDIGPRVADDNGDWIDPAGINEESELSAEETDKQKQFFDSLAAKRLEEQGLNLTEDIDLFEEENVNLPVKKSLGLYRHLVWKFLILVGFLAAVVFYFSFSKLTIFVTPQVEAMSDNIFLKVIAEGKDVSSVADAREQVAGAVDELELEVSKIYRATGEEFEGEEVSGRVIIYNNYTKAQSLVATTRLLSPDNKLYRIKEAVNIPAGGQVEVEVYADTISQEMAIAPTRFIIPGLWIGLQDKIYAESKEAFSYQQKINRYVKASDIQLANSEASTLILQRAKELKPLRSQDEMLYKVLEPIETTLSAKAGDEVGEFTLNVKAKVIMVSFSEDEVARLAAAKLKILVPDDKELTEFEPGSLSYVLENYDDVSKVATVKASFSGFMILKSNAQVIDRERLVNLKAEQIDTYLKDYPEIGSYELEFYPSFVKKAPHLVDRIEIEIKK